MWSKSGYFPKGFTFKHKGLITQISLIYTAFSKELPITSKPLQDTHCQGHKGWGSPSHYVITTPHWGSANSENQIRWPKSLSFLSTSSNISLSKRDLNIIQTPPRSFTHPPNTTSTTNKSCLFLSVERLGKCWKDRHSHHVQNYGPDMCLDRNPTKGGKKVVCVSQPSPIQLCCNYSHTSCTKPLINLFSSGQ